MTCRAALSDADGGRPDTNCRRRRLATRRPGDTIVIAPGAPHEARNVRIDKPLCLVSESAACQAAAAFAQPQRTQLVDVAGADRGRADITEAAPRWCLQLGGGASQDDTVLTCPRGYEGYSAVAAALPPTSRLSSTPGPPFQLLSIVGRLPELVLTPPALTRAPLLDRALEFHANARIANLTVRVELGSCLLHRAGRLRVEGCSLLCDEHPLEHLSCPIVSTAPAAAATAGGATVSVAAAAAKGSSRAADAQNGMCVVETRIEGGESAVLLAGGLVLQQVRVLYARAARIFWFVVARRLPLLPLGAAEELLPAQRLQPRA
eukprot:SM000088S23735  [mRNA]  locus=s88:386946:387905:- [translate_table: standard]